MPFLILHPPFDKFPFSMYFILTEPIPLFKIIQWLPSAYLFQLKGNVMNGPTWGESRRKLGPADHDMPWHAPIRRRTATVKSKPQSSQVAGGKEASGRGKGSQHTHSKKVEKRSYIQLRGWF